MKLELISPGEIKCVICKGRVLNAVVDNRWRIYVHNGYAYLSRNQLIRDCMLRTRVDVKRIMENQARKKV